jgi:hypothetical protein
MQSGEDRALLAAMLAQANHAKREVRHVEELYRDVAAFGCPSGGRVDRRYGSARFQGFSRENCDRGRSREAWV